MLNGNVGVGTTAPGEKLHIYNGASGATSYEATGGLTVERNGRVIIQMLTPAASDAYLMFGSPVAANRGYFGYNHSIDQLILHTSGSTTLDGNVGIGTTNPGTLLNIYGDDPSNRYGAYDAVLRVKGDTFSYLEVEGTGGQAGILLNKDNSTGWFAGLNNNGYFRVADMASINETGLTNAKDGAEGITIDTNGNVGIGTAPGQKLDVVGASLLSNSTVINPDSYTNRVIAGAVSVAGGWSLASAIGGNAGTGHSWGVGSNGNNLYFGYEDQVSANTMQTFMQVLGRNVSLVPTSGNVGIGTTGPNDKLSIGNSGAAPAGSAATGHNYTNTYLSTDNYALVNYGLLKTALATSGNVYGTYTKLMRTPNGGLQIVRILYDMYGEWIVVGKFAADASVSIGTTWSSVSGLSTSVSQTDTTAFSSDFGDAYPTEVRILGATDFNSWRDTRTVDFVYKVPNGRRWRYFFNGGTTDGGIVTSGTARYGFTADGTYDGFGRWINAGNTQIGMSDGPFTNPNAAYVTPTANAFNWYTTQDAKLTAIHGGMYSGQDVTETVGLGYDDAIHGFFDAYPGTASNMTGGDTYSSAVWVLIKLPVPLDVNATTGVFDSVGVGTTNPSRSLTVMTAPTNAMVAGAAAGHLFLTNTGGSSGLYGMYLGVDGNGNGWLQAARNDSATYYNLLLQANGGNVGAGTTNPLNPLHVNGGSTATPGTIGSYAFRADSFTIGSDSSYVYLQSWSSKPLQINNQGNNTLINPVSGYVGIGTTNPLYKLDVNGDIRATSFIYNSSDRNLKQNIATIQSPLEKITQLRGVTFDWKKDNTHSIGLIAQEVEKVFPELVTGQEGSKAVAYGNLVAPLIEAVKAQQMEIKNNNGEINILNEEIAQLKAQQAETIKLNANLLNRLKSLEAKSRKK